MTTHKSRSLEIVSTDMGVLCEYFLLQEKKQTERKSALKVAKSLKFEKMNNPLRINHMLVLLKLSMGTPTTKEQQQIDQIIAYLKKQKQPYMLQVNQGEYEVPEISIGNIVAEIDSNDLEAFVIFLRDLKIERSKICVVYQLDYLRGDGQDICQSFPFNMTLNQFAIDVLGK